MSLSQRVFQQIREHMEAILKGIVLDHWSTVIQTVQPIWDCHTKKNDGPDTQPFFYLV